MNDSKLILFFIESVLIMFSIVYGTVRIVEGWFSEPRRAFLMMAGSYHVLFGFGLILFLMMG